MDGADLQVLTPSSFTGILLTREVTFRFGWVLADTQSVNAAGTPIQNYSRYQVVHEVPALTQKTGYIAVGADEWLPEDKVALVSPQVPADAGANTCRFIYVNLAEQTLTVYDDCKLVFATLVSSGANSWTFEGRFTILTKDAEYRSIMPPRISTSEYYIEGRTLFHDVMQVILAFTAPTGTIILDSAVSHGCINLSPADAKWLYDWAGVGERVIISAGTIEKDPPELDGGFHITQLPEHRWILRSRLRRYCSWISATCSTFSAMAASSQYFPFSAVPRLPAP